MIVALVGFAIAFPLFETFSRLGWWGPPLGFCLVFPYFAILNSRIGHGQTLGKRLMRIRVIEEAGNTISFWKAVARYAVFGVPYFLNEVLLPVTRTPWIVSALVSIVVFGIGGTTLYLILFNRHTRQGLHDLAVGSYVAEADKDGPLRIAPIWRGHWVILGSLLVVTFLGTGILGNKLKQWGPFPQLLEDVRLVEGLKGVQAAGVQDTNTKNYKSGEKQTILIVNVYWTGESTDKQGFPGLNGNLAGDVKEKWASKQAFADQVAKLVIEHDSTVKDHDLLKVVVIRGYNLGIAHAQVSYFYEHTPVEWNARLFGTSPARTLRRANSSGD